MSKLQENFYRKFLFKRDVVLDYDFLALYVEKISGCEIDAKAVEFSSDKLKAIVTFQQPVNVKLLREEAQKAKLDSKINVEPVPASSKVVVHHRPNIDKEVLKLYLEWERNCPDGGTVVSVDELVAGGRISIVEFEETTVAEKLAQTRQIYFKELGQMELELMTPLIDMEDLKRQAKQVPDASADVDVSKLSAKDKNQREAVADHRVENEQKLPVNVSDTASGAVGRSMSLPSGGEPSALHHQNSVEESHLRQSIRSGICGERTAGSSEKMSDEYHGSSSKMTRWIESSSSSPAGVNLKRFSIGLATREKYQLTKKLYVKLYLDSKLVSNPGFEVLFDDHTRSITVDGRDKDAVCTRQKLIDEIVAREVFVEPLPLVNNRSFVTWIEGIIASENIEAVVCAVTDGITIAAFELTEMESAARRLKERCLTGKVRVDFDSAVKEQLQRFIGTYVKGKCVNIKSIDGGFQVFGKPRDVIQTVGDMDEELQRIYDRSHGRYNYHF